MNITELQTYPRALFVVTFIVLWMASLFGAKFLRRAKALDPEVREDFNTVLAATLTLLGLIIGFTFSMATTRYDQRKNLEEEEANAIGTEYVRADLLPGADAAKVRALLRDYLDLRIRFYGARDEEEIRTVDAATARLQNEMWRVVVGPATAQPSPLTALAVSGMNDVLNTQGYTQAAWWNRIPHAAWALMVAIAICCNVLVGYGSRGTRTGARLLLIMPLVVATAFMLVADIDAPRHGIIRVVPQNLISLAESLRPR